MIPNLQTTQQAVASALAAIEGRLNQSSPMGNRAFNRVIAYVLGMIYTGLTRFAISQASAVLAQTAAGSQLDTLGAEYNLPRNQATAAVATINVPCVDGTAIPLGTYFLGANGLQYVSTIAATSPSGAPGAGANVNVTCQTAGSAGNVGIGSAMTLTSPIAGATPTCSVTAITTTAVDVELDAAYSLRILAIERAYGGGGNAADYRIWAEAVPGVANAFPYAGLPYYGQLSAVNCYAAQAILITGAPTGGTFTLTYNGQVSAALNYNCAATDIQAALRALTGASSVTVSLLANGSFLVTGFAAMAPIALGTNSLTGGTAPTVYVIPNEPPARTVYVAATGMAIPSSGLLASVTAAIQKNLNTGNVNQPLGLTMDSLYVMPIIKTSFYVLLSGLVVPSGQTATVQAAMLTAAQAYFLGLFPYVDGVDPPSTRNDLITQTSLAGALQAVLSGYGASCQAVGFGTSLGSFLATYQLGQGETGQCVSVTYQ